MTASAARTTWPAWCRPALLTVLRSGYSRHDLVRDGLAGLLVGVVAMPLSMGLAIASGVPPVQGLYTSILGGIVVSLLGGSRVQIAGPAGAFVGLCAYGVKEFGYDGLALATCMAGAMIVLMGVMRLGRAMSLIPMPVVIGFTSGIAVIIASTQIAPALGLQLPHGPPSEQVGERLQQAWRFRHTLSWGSVLVLAGTMSGIMGMKRLTPRLPGPVIALSIVTCACWIIGRAHPGLGIATIQSQYGAFQGSLPPLHLPSLGLAHGAGVLELAKRLQQLSGLALAIALLGSIESLLSALVADGLSGYRHEPNSELVAQGCANLLSPLLLGLPVTGVIARTSTNVRAGAVSPVAGIVHSLCILVFVLFLGPLVGQVPLACLAGILLMVCWHMAELRHWPHILGAHQGDAILLPLTFLLTVIVGLTYAVTIGVVLGMLFFIRRSADSVRLDKVESGSELEHASFSIPGVLVYEVQGPFFFGAATLIRGLQGALDQSAVALILRLEHVPFIDATAGFALRELIHACKKQGVRFVLCEIHSRSLVDLQRLGLTELIGEENLFASTTAALDAVAVSSGRARTTTRQVRKHAQA